ncbi:sulfate transporter 2.1 isoform X2 [Diospyros lotus]|uniref:sulfate transporter 2.1 isoform X2 n=1 Tax=Diospyros lotus TaxID=55363 RepID=UPI00224DE4F0|nr:sulfate transporter 2.1 isoform X2 [Diospyros lotus]
MQPPMGPPPPGIVASGESGTHPIAREADQRELSKFSQTLQLITMPSSASVDTTTASCKVAEDAAVRARWVLDPPRPPGLGRRLADSIAETAVSHRNKLRKLKEQPLSGTISVLEAIFPILVWFRSYSPSKFKNDLLAGLTLASLCIPQSIGYATLAKLDPQYGLYTSVVPPLIYAAMGTSRELAIGPVAVVSLLLSSIAQKLEDPDANPLAYTRLVLTITFFSGVFQTAFGLLRLGFLVDFLSHAAIVGFMAGAAIVIGLQQLKGLLGLTHFTNKTDIISVLKVVWTSVHHNPWNPYNFILGCSFLIFILITRFLGRRSRKLFWLPATAPLVSVILSTLIVFLTRADEHGVKIVKHIKGGLNPSSVHQLQFSGPHASEVAKIGLIVAVIALTEAIAVGRSFASMKGYHLDGNKEMMAMGFMNIVGSFTSCYTGTGSFSRSAVNHSAGCETAMSNIVMAITVLLSLQFFTRLLYYTPNAILASIILSALPGLVDLNEAYYIWRVDKLDFLACIAAFFGVLFASVEIGLLLAVMISFAKIILNTIQPGIENLGRLPGTDVFYDVNQYPMTIKTPGILTIRIRSALLCFANASFVIERILKSVDEEEDADIKGTAERGTQLVILDMSSKLDEHRHIWNCFS